MYVIKLNKRMLVITLLITIFMTFAINISDSKFLKVNATPITNKIIVIDGGHGKPDEGTSTKSGVTEQKLNLEIALRLQKYMEQSGAKVILTRSDENGIYETDKTSIRSKKISDMKERVRLGNELDADIFVSIHMNYFEQSKYKGWQTFYQSNNAESKKLAKHIQEALDKNMYKTSRVPMAIKGAYIMDNIVIPTVIVECGFLSNKDDEINLQTNEYQDKLAWGIYLGIQNYFEEEINCD